MTTMPSCNDDGPCRSSVGWGGPGPGCSPPWKDRTPSSSALPERTLRALDEHGLGPEGRRADVALATAGSLDVSRAGPLGTYATLLAELDGLVVALHDAGPAEWAHQAQRRLRRDLAAAAAIEAALLEGTTPP